MKFLRLSNGQLDPPSQIGGSDSFHLCLLLKCSESTGLDLTVIDYAKQRTIIVTCFPLFLC